MSILDNRRDAETRRNSNSPSPPLCQRGGRKGFLYASVFKIVLAASLFISFPHILQASEAKIPKVSLDLSEAAVKRGEEVFKASCQTCHSLKYLGYEAMITPDAAKEAFGKVPPDLTLMAKARGRGDNGARYIYALLVSYNDTPEKNSIFPNIAMPPVLSKDDPEFERKAKDVAAFLLYAAEPSAGERKRLGIYVMGYMVVLTALLYFLNRRTWRGIKYPHFLPTSSLLHLIKFYIL